MLISKQKQIRIIGSITWLLIKKNLLCLLKQVRLFFLCRSFRSSQRYTRENTRIQGEFSDQPVS